MHMSFIQIYRVHKTNYVATGPLFHIDAAYRTRRFSRWAFLKEASYLLWIVIAAAFAPFNVQAKRQK